jgi:ligand-binding sensor domain-containing protein
MKLLHFFCLLVLPGTFMSCKGQSRTKPVTGTPESTTIPTGKLYTDTAYAKIVKCLLRDRAGNIWIATTWNGVFRYDGTTFLHFTERDGLCSKMVNTIYEDNKGIIWFGTGNGVCRYDGKNFTTLPIATIGGDQAKSATQTLAGNTSFLYGQHLQNLAPVIVESIIQDSKGNMWFGIWNSPGKLGVHRYDGKTFTEFLTDRPIQGMVEDKEGGIWLNCNRYDGSALTDLSKKKHAFGDQVVRSLKDKEGNLWFGVRANGLYRYDGRSFTYFSDKDGLPAMRVLGMFQDKKGRLWLGSDVLMNTDKGALCYYDGSKFTYLPDVYNIGMYSIWTVAEDNKGNMWFGGRGAKLCSYDGKHFIDWSSAIP